MLTINRNKTEDKRNRAYDSRVRENSYRTLDEEYQNTIVERQNQSESELWDRLNYQAPYQATEERERFDYETRNSYYNEPRSSAYSREEHARTLPMYNTEASSSEMAIKKYNVAPQKKKSNVVGKIILAAYIAIITLVAALVIVDSTRKTTAASTGSVAGQQTEYEYITFDDVEESSNWFDAFCDSFGD